MTSEHRYTSPRGRCNDCGESPILVTSIRDCPDAPRVCDSCLQRREDADRPVAKGLDLSRAEVGSLIDSEPPARDWIVANIIALGIVGILAAAGGVGKSMAKLLLAVAACVGLPWFGMPVVRTGSVLVFSAEDDRDEIHRRLHSVLRFYRNANPERAAQIDELVRERLHIFDRVGADNRLTVKRDGLVGRTELVEQIIATAKALPGLVLIVLDPLSRFDGGDPNDNSDGTRLIECAEHIRKATGATVLLSHHVAKTSLGNPESGQEAVRGASGLVDGARWVGLLQSLRQSDAKKYGIEASEAGNFVRFTAPKANYARPWPGIWLTREAGGVLVPTELEEVKSDTSRQRGEDRYEETMPKLLELVRRKQIDGEPLTHNKLRTYAGAGGHFGVGDQTLRAIVQRAIEEHRIREHHVQPAKGKTRVELHSW